MKRRRGVLTICAKLDINDNYRGQFRFSVGTGLADRCVTPHVMRHTFAVHFLEGGAAVTDLQAVMGHASLTTTQIYAQALDARTKASVEALDFDSSATRVAGA